jgi:hypothetical protein
MFQQNILAELSSSLFDHVQVYKNKMLGHFGELENVSAYYGPLLYGGEAYHFVSAAFLEAGIAEYKYGRVDASRSFSLSCIFLSLWVFAFFDKNQGSCSKFVNKLTKENVAFMFF